MTTRHIEQLEAEFYAARDAAYAARIDISPREWEALKARAARVVDGTAYDANGRQLGWAFRSRKYGLLCTRLTDDYAPLRAAMSDIGGRLTAAKKAAGHFRPTGAALEEQRRRSRLGRTRPAGTPRAHHLMTAA